MKVGIVGRRHQRREYIHRGQDFRIGHQRQLDQALDRALIEEVPDRLVFGLDLLQGRVRGQVNAESAETRECTVDGLRVLTLHFMQIDIEAGGFSVLDVGSCALQQLSNKLRGLLEVTS